MNPRYHILLIMLFSGILFLDYHSYADKVDVFVYVNTDQKAFILQEKMAELLDKKGTEISVFGKYEDFNTMVMSEEPEILITKPENAERYNNYRLYLPGVYKGRQSLSLSLTSISEGFDLSNLSEKRIGVVNFLGRSETAEYVQEVLNKGVSVKTVTKIEDLLPLLTFRMADAVLVTEKEVNFLKQKSKMTFSTHEISDSKSGVVSVYLNKGLDSAPEVSGLREIPDELGIILGVDRWKK